MAESAQFGALRFPTGRYGPVEKNFASSYRKLAEIETGVTLLRHGAESALAGGIVPTRHIWEAGPGPEARS